MNTDDYDSFVNVPCVLFEGKHNDSYLAAYLGCDQSSFGDFCLHFCINGKRKSVNISQDDFYEFTGLTDEDCPDSIGCCEKIDDIIKGDLAEYVIDWTIDYLYNVQANTPEKVNQFVKQQLKVYSYQLIWLCDSRTNSAEYADSNEPDHIYSVNLRNKTILPISDLGCEGFLIAYK